VGFQKKGSGFRIGNQRASHARVIRCEVIFDQMMRVWAFVYIRTVMGSSSRDRMFDVR
jgi:hypothetical protein